MPSSPMARAIGAACASATTCPIEVASGSTRPSSSPHRGSRRGRRSARSKNLSRTVSTAPAACSVSRVLERGLLSRRDTDGFYELLLYLSLRRPRPRAPRAGDADLNLQDDDHWHLPARARAGGRQTPRCRRRSAHRALWRVRARLGG